MADAARAAMIDLRIGDCRAILPTLADESVHCVVTSPPYFGLRDYGTAQWEGGDGGCDHIRPVSFESSTLGASTGGRSKETHSRSIGAQASPYRYECSKCGARRIDAQIGLEPTPDAFVAELVAVFREVRRVLRKDGTLWLNLGDSYAGGGRGGGADGSKQQTNVGSLLGAKGTYGLKAKDLIGIPWRVAFALQADGWYLRQDIIWSKPNPMPESVTDRCTKAHEYLFLLAKNERYFFDAEAIREEAEYGRRSNFRGGGAYLNQANGQANSQKSGDSSSTFGANPDVGRNKRSVWTIATQPFSDAHFATFPPALIEPCILAGCPAKACAKCGVPWVRQIERQTSFEGGSGKAGRSADEVNGSGKWAGIQHGNNIKLGPVVTSLTLGFSPSCACNADTVPGIVLDPFAGAGTTGLVARNLNRLSILIELNASYADMANVRIHGPLFAEPLQP